MLSHLGLWDRRKEKVVNWSRGMKQKLAIAKAMLHRPTLIFLDEPTAGLDPVAAAGLRDDLSALAAHEGVTVFLTTHNLAEAEKMCAQVGIVREGKLLAVGHPDELRVKVGGPQAEIIGRGFDEQTLAILRARPEVSAANLRNGRLLIDLKTKSDVASLVSSMVMAGVEIREVRKGDATLEETFMTLTAEEK